MSTPQRLTPAQVDREVSREVARIRAETSPPARAARGPQCRVCADDESRRRVNMLLGIGKGPAEIVRHLEDINVKRRKNRQITVNSVRDHRNNHFNIQAPAQAAQLRVLEQRAAEEDVDILSEGVRNILTARGMLQIVAEKGFETLTDPNTKIDVEIGVNAQIALEKMIKADAEIAERAALRRDVALIQQAIREEFDEDQMRRLSHRLDILRGVTTEEDHDNVIEGVVVDDEDDYDDDDVADFVSENDDDDELE